MNDESLREILYKAVYDGTETPVCAVDEALAAIKFELEAEHKELVEELKKTKDDMIFTAGVLNRALVYQREDIAAIDNALSKIEPKGGRP